MPLFASARRFSGTLSQAFANTMPSDSTPGTPIEEETETHPLTSFSFSPPLPATSYLRPPSPPSPGSGSGSIYSPSGSDIEDASPSPGVDHYYAPISPPEPVSPPPSDSYLYSPSSPPFPSSSSASIRTYATDDSTPSSSPAPLVNPITEFPFNVPPNVLHRSKSSPSSTEPTTAPIPDLPRTPGPGKTLLHSAIMGSFAAAARNNTGHSAFGTLNPEASTSTSTLSSTSTRRVFDQITLDKLEGSSIPKNSNNKVAFVLNPSGNDSSATLLGKVCNGKPGFNAGGTGTTGSQYRMRSTMISGPISKPWLSSSKSHREPLTSGGRYVNFATAFCIFLGLVASLADIYMGYKGLRLPGRLCLVLDDEFNGNGTDVDETIWEREVNMGGFGNGEFEMTTSSMSNSFVSNGSLFILPTLTSSVIGSAAVLDGHTYNITNCTSSYSIKHPNDCGRVSNTTAGTVINPVMSARLTTKKSVNIKYGKVEVRAKLPLGDWLWPAIWMLPVNDTYGPWPMSGEIDIMESRGNLMNYTARGNNFVQGTLNWGPTTWMNAAYKTFGFWSERRTPFSDGFHVYALEWTEEYIRIYVDNRLANTVYLTFDKESFFTRGDFPDIITNGSQEILLQNPWEGRANSAPFDQPFYLILNVAVGGTNGWFPDAVGGKPWINGDTNAMQQFAQAQDQWYATWPKGESWADRAMQVDYVKMWRKC